ncbi:GTP-binding protein [Brachyspira catarrhinii]|uniref:GTPase n=1 Tax=Brachyspira catarrhinii TaxID=2528966 RepID=A0ABY2TQQ8_9SPIR|nr:GTP-binding protein [Brachyspira catarrhinii]TKZ34323.1 GTPase [Brachyspira catarrhinii]
MKILIVSGFLGAGKTTLIKEMANKTRRDFVILENEYGDVDIDSNILKDEGMNIWELTEGCVCCSMKQDFATSILTIANTLDPEYLIVEPTGVAKLGNIINNIRQIEYERIILLKPITVIDGNAFDSFISSYDNIYIDQLVNTSKIIISKMESKDIEENEELIKKIENLLIKNNVSLSEIEILKEHYTKKNKEWWENILKSFLDEKYSVKEKESENTEEMPDSISMKGCEIENENQFVILLEDTIRGRFGDIARAKGFIKCGKSYFRFDVAGERYAITGATENDELEIVFIGKNLNRKLLREIFQPVYRENIKHSH